MQRSESIAKLAEALAAAQGEMKGAAKDSLNPFFHSKYADLASVMDACRVPLASNNLSVMHFPRVIEQAVEVDMILAHSSGEWVSETLKLPAMNLVKDAKTGELRERFDAQTIGSAITYARRYLLSALVGVAAEDDDGNAAAQSQNVSTQAARTKFLDVLTVAADKGTPALEAAWKIGSPELRKSAQDQLPFLKSIALKKDEANNAPVGSGAKN